MSSRFRVASTVDGDIIFTDDEIGKIIKKLQSYGKAPSCEVCGVKKWAVGGVPITHSMFDLRNDRHALNQARLTVFTECTKCGNTKYFNAKYFGLTTKRSPDLDAPFEGPIDE